MNNLGQKVKPKLNMTTKSPSRKQIIIPIKSNNAEIVIAKANIYVSNVNRLWMGVKSEIFINFICSDNKGLLITTNKVDIISNLNIIKKYVKDLNNIDSNNIISLRLPQSKSYLKILSIPYFVKDTNLSISSDIIESIIKSNHIFNSIILVLWPHIIKASPKVDILVIWIDICDSQNSSNAKILINKCFNIGSHIATICDTNMNPSVFQCKNCWKWGHTIFAYHTYRAKYLKCNKPYKTGES